MYEVNKILSKSKSYLQDINDYVEKYFEYNISTDDVDYYQVFTKEIYKGILVNFGNIFMFFPNGLVPDVKFSIINDQNDIISYYGNHQVCENGEDGTIISYKDVNNNTVLYKKILVSDGVLEYQIVNMISKESLQYQFISSDFIDENGKLVVPKIHLDEPNNSHYIKNINNHYHEFWIPILIDNKNIINYIKAIKAESRTIGDFSQLMEVALNNEMPELERYIQVNTIYLNGKYIKLPLTNITSKKEYQDFIYSQIGTCFDWHMTSDIINLYNGTNENVNDMQSIIKPITLERTKNL